MRMHTLFGALAALSLSVAAVFAHEYKLNHLVLSHPWSRATPPGAKVGGGFVVIANSGAEADRLLKAEAAFAGKVELHEMKVENGVMTMRPLANGIEIPAGGEAALKPGGLHVMFMDLKEPLKEGEMRKARLVFEKAGAIEVEFKVEAVGAGHGAHGVSN
jgi:hypothetical protein